jgi:glucan phosphoethanolaminetransferase (alkaline phosphatase superfamily)
MILVLFFIFIYLLSLREDRSFKSHGLKWFSLFTIVIIISGIMNNSELYASFRMYSRVLWPYLFFLAIYNINLSPSSIRKINKFIIFMVILQIPAAVYKYMTYGVREDGIIGTFSTQAGALSTIFPLFIIGYL